MNRRTACHRMIGSCLALGSISNILQAAPRIAPAGTTGTSKLQWQQNLKGAQKLALQQNKPMLIVFGASWCTYCHKLERETLSDRRIVNFIEQEFIPVHLDFDKDAKIAKILEVERLPCTVILTPEADLLLRSEGFAVPKDFQATLSSALEKRSEIQQARATTPR